ncbi:hypothetical protein H0484_12785 [Pusillimonas sp. CC-YST705]|uniref:Uncharacterized protein n=1 Tax=Mesopusillimonas faecipullorum TaxID=2755040 RepID=A0ABS8CFP0_9BURK|nr:hypothetical protein [Mesopusillimonas faecipullorum]MCB5364624.1 hypothetical protein [Mesopusillimonas faecipullorum]
MRPTPKDATSASSLSALRGLVLRLTATSKIICAVVIIVVAMVAYHLLGSLLSFGKGLDYAALGGFSAQATELAKQYMPLFWWGLAIVIALAVLSILYRYACASHQSAKHRIVNADDFTQLTRQLSPEAREVLAWAWEDRRHPVTVGILQRTIQELRSGRSGKIHLANTHAQALAAPIDIAAPAPHIVRP